MSKLYSGLGAASFAALALVVWLAPLPQELEARLLNAAQLGERLAQVKDNERFDRTH